MGLEAGVTVRGAFEIHRFHQCAGCYTKEVQGTKQRWHTAGLVVKCALNHAGAKYGPSGTILEALGKVHRVQLMHGVATNKLLRCPRATRGLLR